MKDNTSNLKQLSDMSMELTNKQILDLLQLTNANFPIGSFSHSFGLETFIRHDIIKDSKTLKEVMKPFLFGQFLHVDMLAILKVYSHLQKNEIDKVFIVDQLASCQGMAKETRKSTRQIGTQMLKIYLELFPDNELLKQYQDKVTKKECYAHPAVVFSIFCFTQNIDIKACLYVHLYSTSSALVQNCVRAIPLGQVEGQKVMLSIKNEMFDELLNKCFTIDIEKNFCKNNPSFEVAQINHEEILIRLFMS